MKEISIDSRRRLIVPGDKEATLNYAIEMWVQAAKEAIKDKGYFTVALSGGSTPKEIFRRLASEHKQSLDWGQVYMFWSDERSVSPTDSQSNYHMAMQEAGLQKLPLWDEHIFRMVAEKEIEKNAKNYEHNIIENTSNGSFDLIMLGMGDDGHTASLFPHTQALKETQALVVANYVPQKETWRMTFTYPLINKSKRSVFYVLGTDKQQVLSRVLCESANFEELPSFQVGTPQNPALWICDTAASAALKRADLSNS